MAHYRQRIGFYSIRRYARLMCKYIVQFQPAIVAAFPDNALLHAALNTAMVACEALVAQIDLEEHPGV